jgi:hypothetical protein
MEDDEVRTEEDGVDRVGEMIDQAMGSNDEMYSEI